MSRLSITPESLQELSEQTDTAIEHDRALLKELPVCQDDELLEDLVEQLEEYGDYWSEERRDGGADAALAAARNWFPVLHPWLRRFVARIAVLEGDVSEPVPLDSLSLADAQVLLELTIDCVRVIGLCPEEPGAEVAESAPPGWVRVDYGHYLAAHPDRPLFERARWTDKPLFPGVLFYDVASFDAYVAALVVRGRLDPDGPRRVGMPNRR